MAGDAKNTREHICTSLYSAWLDRLFALAPKAPSCEAQCRWHLVQVRQEYGNAPNVIVLRLDNVSGSQHTSEPLNSRAASVERADVMRLMWETTVNSAGLPPRLELLVNVADKPRLAPAQFARLGLPLFSWSTEYGLGSGDPTKWTGVLPFPSANNWALDNDSMMQKLAATPANQSEFEKWSPGLYYRGRFSENEWRRFGTRNQAWRRTPRFKLANATRSRDPLVDVKLTGFEVPLRNMTEKTVAHMLWRKYGITMGKRTPLNTAAQRQLALSVPGNGWAGTTTQRALLSGSCMLAIVDTATDAEGWTRNLGEAYFPFLVPGVHYIPATYEGLAESVRALAREPALAFSVASQGMRIAAALLTRECATELIRLLAWRYWHYVNSGCDHPFQCGQ